MEECFSFRQTPARHPRPTPRPASATQDYPAWQRVRTEPSLLREKIEDKLQSTRKTFDTAPGNQIGYFQVSLADLVQGKRGNSRESTASKSERQRGDSWRRESRQSSSSKGSVRKQVSKEKGKQAMADVLNGFLNRLNSMSGRNIAPKDIHLLKSHLNKQDSSSTELDKILLANLHNLEQFSSNPLQTSQKLSKMLSVPSHPRLSQLKPLCKLQTRKIERTLTDSSGREFRVIVQRMR